MDEPVVVPGEQAVVIQFSALGGVIQRISTFRECAHGAKCGSVQTLAGGVKQKRDLDAFRGFG